MSINASEPEVKDIERVEIPPAEGEDVQDEEIETPADSSQPETETVEGDEPETEKSEDEEVAETETQEDETTEEVADESDDNTTAPENEKYGEVKRVPGESPKEFALRIENARLRDEIRDKKVSKILTPPPTATRQEMSPERKKVLEKYKPEDIATLKEVFDVMAEDMGFVKGDQLQASTFQEKSREIFNEFLSNHKEYLPENDKDNILWNRFETEFNRYKVPTTHQDLKTILNKVHKEVYGIKPAAAFNKNNAAIEKVKVASHSGSSRPTPSREGVKRAVAPQGLRTDMLKGFSEEEIAELSGE